MESKKKKKLIDTDNRFGGCQRPGVGVSEMDEGNQKL